MADFDAAERLRDACIRILPQQEDHLELCRYAVGCSAHRRSTFSQMPSNQAPCPPSAMPAALWGTPTRSPSLKGCERSRLLSWEYSSRQV